MDAAQWHQEIGLLKPTELVSSSSYSSTTITTASNICTTARPQVAERRARPQKEQALNCPRCNSTNTKFCYYNNYSLTQPRYFCKACRRYWTEGGSLRYVPVGGGSRKNKRSSPFDTTTTETSATASNNKKLPTDLVPPPISLSTTTHKFHDGEDFDRAVPHHGFPDFNNSSSTSNSSNTCNAVAALPAMELLGSGMTARGIRPHVPMPLPEYPLGFGLQEFGAPTLAFPMEGVGEGGGGGGGGSSGRYGALQGVQESADGRLLFPFEDANPVVHISTAAEFENSRKQAGGDPPGFFNGKSGGGGSW